MPYAIMRSKKVKSVGHAAATCKHMFREQETDNADPTRTPTNTHLAARSTSEAVGKLKERLPEKRRKDAVVAVEYLMTASPEWWAKATEQQQADWVDKSRQWLVDKYGEANLVACTVHRDEATPHLTALVVPMTKDGRLSAREMIGDRDQMKRDQTSYAEAVRHLGLSRGIEGSKAKHETIKSYYGRIAAARKAAEAIPERLPPPVKPAPAPEPPARHWWGAETAEHRAWRASEAKKAKQHQDKVKAWRKADQERQRMVEDLAAKAGSLALDAKQGQELKQRNVKLSAAARKAQDDLQRVLATPGVAEAVEAHKARQDAQGRAQAAEAAKEGKAFDQSLAARQQAEKEAAEPKPRPSRSRDLDNDGPSFGR